MSLSAREVEKVARLARLDLAPSEIEEMAAKLGRVLDYVRQIEELDTRNVEPMAHAADVRSVFRDDRRTPSLPRELALAGAPRHDARYYLVPPILDETT